MLKGVTLRGLEVFEALARSGSVAGAAELTGLSLPAVSQQLRNLEAALGVALVDHGRRPMQLTAAGRNYLARAQTALGQLRLAQNEITVSDLSHVARLSLGVIDDFDNDVTPRLATLLAENMVDGRLRLVTASSLDLRAALEAGRLQMAFAASSGEALDGIREVPFIQDPFLLVLPRHRPADLTVPKDALAGLPFLRYDREQLIARQIEAHLGPIAQDAPERFEIGAHLSLMTLVARGVGWAVTTPLGYMRAVRLHDRIEALPLPGAPFSRTISLFARQDWGEAVPRDITRAMAGLVEEQVIAPATHLLPWVSGSLRMHPFP